MEEKPLSKHMDVVKEALEKAPICRDDDFKLYVIVCNILNLDIHKSLYEWAREPIGYPAVSSIIRCRRKIQVEYPHLLGKRTLERAEREAAIRKEMVDS